MLQTDFVPAAEADSKHLMVVLHGLGDSMEGYRFLPQVMDLPWMNYLLVNAPDEYYGGFKWFDYPPGERMGEEVARSRKMLVELLDEQFDRRFSATQTFMFGFSQGCLMSVEIGIRYPQKFAGIVGISGWAHEPATLIAEQSPVAKQQSFLVTHGTYDPLLPYSMAKGRFDELAAGGMNIKWHSFPKEHTIYGEEELKVIREFLEAKR